MACLLVEGGGMTGKHEALSDWQATKADIAAKVARVLRLLGGKR